MIIVRLEGGKEGSCKMFSEMFQKTPRYATFAPMRFSQAVVCEKFIAEISGADGENAATNS